MINCVLEMFFSARDILVLVLMIDKHVIFFVRNAQLGVYVNMDLFHRMLGRKLAAMILFILLDLNR